MFSREANNAQSSEFFMGDFHTCSFNNQSRHSMRIIFGHYTKYIQTWGLYSVLYSHNIKKKTTVIVTIYLLATVTFPACVFIFKIVQCVFKNIQLMFCEQSKSALF